MSTTSNLSANTPGHYKNSIVHSHIALPAVQISTATIAGVHSTRITYQGRVICLTQQLAQFYGCTEKNIRDNYANNRERFEEGKHFIFLEGDALNLFKQGIPDEIGDPLKFTARLMLWTELGAARHAKMLTTDRAWDVFEQLEEAYFRQADQPSAPTIDSHEGALLALQQLTAQQLALIQEKKRTAAALALAAPKVNFFDKVVKRTTLMTASQIGQKLGMSAIKLNKRLDELGVYSLNVKRARVFKQWVIEKGYGELKQTEQGFSQPLFTTAGEAWIVERLTSEGVA